MDDICRKKTTRAALWLLIVVCVLLWENGTLHAAPYVATTSVSLSVCGDAIVTGSEYCDDGTNTGAYGDSIANRNCDPLCDAFGPYCGDAVLQTLYGEECDDGNNTAGDLCDAACLNESSPVVESGGSGGGGGGGGGSSGNNGDPDAAEDGTIEFDGDTELLISGKAYPGSTVTVLQDGEIEGVVEADSDANFDYRLFDPTPGATTFGFWAEDREGRRSITFSTTFQIVENAVTNLSGLVLPPTIELTPEKLPQGETLTVAGQSMPDAQIFLTINAQEYIEETLSSATGEYEYLFDTTPLQNEAFHSIKANAVDPDAAELESGYSQIANFYVGIRDVDQAITADLNLDGNVDLVDFSILLFNWNTTNVIADINQDGTVGLTDFSIMLFNWTG